MCNACWPFCQALHFMMASYMLCLHTNNVNKQNGARYAIAIKSRFALMVECKASPTSPHHFKVHCSSNLFFATFFPTKLVLTIVDVSFNLSCTLGCQ